MALGVPILKHFRVFHKNISFETVKSKVIILTFKIVRITVLVPHRNLLIH